MTNALVRVLKLCMGLFGEFIELQCDTIVLGRGTDMEIWMIAYSTASSNASKRAKTSPTYRTLFVNSFFMVHHYENMITQV